MQKLILMLALSAVGVFCANSKSQAQHFVTSFGASVSWGVPEYVSHVVYDSYYDYDWVHANRVVHHGHSYFDLVLQRGNIFVEVRVGGHGRVVRSRYYDYYPLNNHVCGHSCGYHDYYYQSYYTGCNSHHHHGHNHVVYRPRPVTYVYGQYHHRGRGNKYGHYKNGHPKHKGKGHKKGHRRYADYDDDYYDDWDDDWDDDRDRRSRYREKGRVIERPASVRYSNSRRSSVRRKGDDDDHHRRKGSHHKRGRSGHRAGPRR